MQKKLTTIPECLSHYSEAMPEWLKNFSPDSTVSFTDIMKERIGYYPGCGDDGQLIKLCSKSHTVHAFLYVDYLTKRRDVIKTLKSPTTLNGYHLIGHVEFNEKDLLPHGKYPSITTRKPLFEADTFQHPHPYCIMGVWERDDDRDDSWGVKRLAVIFLCADAIDSYYQLFVMQYRKAPWILLLQDHGLGCNYDRFGKGGLLDEIIEKSAIRPTFVLCGSGTNLWDGYMDLNCEPSIGGMHKQPRKLYTTIHDNSFRAHLGELWLLLYNHNGGSSKYKGEFGCWLGNNQIDEISTSIAAECGMFEHVIAEYVSRIIRLELAQGKTEIHIYPDGIYESEFIIIMCTDD